MTFGLRILLRRLAVRLVRAVRAIACVGVSAGTPAPFSREDRLRRAMAIARIGFFDWDLRTNEIVFSDRMREDWGLPESPSLDAALAAIHPEDRAQVDQVIARSLSGCGEYRTEYRVVRPADGRVVYVETQGEVIFDSAQRPIRFFGTSIEISERRTSAAQLALERHKLDAMFDAAPAAMVLWRGEDLIFERVNPQYQAIFPGRRLDGLPLAAALPELAGQPFHALCRRVFETGEPYVGKAVPAWLRDSATGQLRQRFYDFSYVQIRNADGKPYGVFDHSIDVTDAVQSSRRILESEARFRVLSEDSPQMIWILDPGGKLSFVNKYWARFTGRSVEDTLAGGYANLVHPRDRAAASARLEAALGSGRDFYSEFRLRRASDGAYVWHASRGRAIRDGEGNITQWVGITTDIDAQKRENERGVRALASEKAAHGETSRFNEELRREKAVRERFVSALTHDLRNPISAARVMTELLARSGREDPEIGRLTTRIIADLDRTDRMIQDLLDATRIKAGEPFPIRPESARIADVVAQAVQGLSSIHGPRFRVHDDSARALGVFDPAGIRRVIENLGGNAVKYGKPHASIDVFVSATDEWIRIGVGNEGDPIPDEELAGLFEPYRRSASAESGRELGWGVGLTLVKGIAEAHRGRAWATSSQEGGTRFSIEFPRNGPT